MSGRTPVTDAMIEAALDAFYGSMEWQESKGADYYMVQMRLALERSAEVGRETITPIDAGLIGG